MEGAGGRRRTLAAQGKSLEMGTHPANLRRKDRPNRIQVASIQLYAEMSREAQTEEKKGKK